MNYNIRELFTTTFPKNDGNFEHREEQIVLAEKIAQTMEQGKVLVSEAGTGIGKSFAYILPALLQAQQGNQVVIATATIALQHQLIDKDIPRLQALLGTDVPVTILKGRSNYLCKRRYNILQTNDEGKLFSTEGLESLNKWVHTTSTGDREEMGYFSPKAKKLWSEVCTHEYSCGGRSCSAIGYNGCFYSTARNKARTAGIIIVNYSLLTYHLSNLVELGDQNTEATKGEGLLPSNVIYILDEAHNLKDIIRQNLTKSISKRDIENIYDALFGRKGNITLEQQSRGGFEPVMQQLIDNIKNKLQSINNSMDKIQTHTTDVQQAQDLFQFTNEIDYNKIFGDGNIAHMFSALAIDMQSIVDALQQMVAYFSDGSSLREIIEKYSRLLGQLVALALGLSEENKKETIVRSCIKLENKNEYVYAIAPLYVNSFLYQSLFSQSPAVICTSATLTTTGSFDYWANQCGVPQNYDQLLLPSPFPYKKNVLLAVPTDAPSPKEATRDSYQQYLSEMLPQCLEHTNGRALILCTSRTMVSYIYNALKAHETKATWNLLVQTKDSMVSDLSHKFRQDINSVLVATASFWEGFDAPGDTLKLVVITQLPFMPPNNLFFKQEENIIKSRDGNAFVSLSLPHAELRLRQGFGRLMRSQSDSGIVFVTDSRLYSTRYGSQLRAALPECTNCIAPTAQVLREIQAHSSLQ